MKYKALLEQARGLVQKADAMLTEFEGQDLPEEKAAEVSGLMAQAEKLQARAEQLKAVEQRDAELQEKIAAEPEAKAARPGEDKAFEPVYVMRFGEESKAQQAVMSDLVGKDYRQTIWEQNLAFAKYLRHGDGLMGLDERRLLTKQVFPWDQVQYLLMNGRTVNEIKSTMVEAQGSLGGYAVPPNVQAEIASRLPGRSVVRSGGATVVDLVNGNSIDVPVYTGGDSRYRGALRGLWGAETQTPAEDNATLGTTPVVAHIYTYKVPMSQSLVEDAANLVELVTRDIADTLAIDEDEAFLIGDGTNKPYGILPGSANGLSLTEVVSGHATALTADGLIGLSDALDEQYMERARFIFNKATGTAVRKLKTGDGEYLFDRDLQNNKRTLLGYPFNRSEAMADIAASAYPIIFADLAGYRIVQKFGLTIVRFQDSNTGINKVEYHVRRRVGGRVVETWMFAAQKVAAS